jgi:hypothetical protein
VYCESLSNYQPLLYKCGYHLYAALSRFDPWLHGGACLIMPLGRGFMVRLPRGDAWRLVGLEGATLEVGYHKVPVGRVVVQELAASVELHSPLVMFDHTIRVPGGPKHGKKRGKTGTSLVLSIGAALERMDIQGARLELDAGERRMDLGPKGAMHGQGVTLKGLTPAHSLKIQRMGIGAKGRMGCGVFVPLIRG